MFSGIEVVGHAPRFASQWLKICTLIFCLLLVYQKLGYIIIVGTATEMCMHASVEEVQALPEYSTKGEVQVTAN
jgi:hypothetical protein